MKFDVEIGNPPYSGNLHLKIINSVLPYLKEDGTASFIHPARWIEDPLAEYKRGTDKVKFNNIIEQIDSVKIINNRTVNTKFGIQYNGELMISKIKGVKTHKTISIFNEIAQDCIDTIVKYSRNHNLDQHIELNEVDGWRCQITRVIPIKHDSHNGDTEYSRKTGFNLFGLKKNNVFKDGLDENGNDWTITRVKNQYTKPVGSPFPQSIKFDSKDEALNFQESCNVNFYNNIMILLKHNSSNPLDFLPWMEDYSHPWTDEDYCEFFGKLGMSETCQKWMCREVYDYRVKDFVDYETFDDSVLKRK